ncbi:amino acid--tRNA ligase-related protein [Nocardia brevicatena]|uniref:amino acid--tRNA ligase-related protein n=1 Tax=Nocardia brevicatena TaxID=37327 RepID=UPI00031C623B|nr:amino acid--tRNA ligase-related protein [Nocardia brevicatena]
MPQGELDALNNQEPLDILAWQYDVVCNGIELSSGAVRNHDPAIMYEAFRIADYDSAAVLRGSSAMNRTPSSVGIRTTPTSTASTTMRPASLIRTPRPEKLSRHLRYYYTEVRVGRVNSP